MSRIKLLVAAIALAAMLSVGAAQAKAPVSPLRNLSAGIWIRQPAVAHYPGVITLHLRLHNKSHTAPIPTTAFTVLQALDNYSWGELPDTYVVKFDGQPIRRAGSIVLPPLGPNASAIHTITVRVESDGEGHDYTCFEGLYDVITPGKTNYTVPFPTKATNKPCATFLRG